MPEFRGILHGYCFKNQTYVLFIENRMVLLGSRMTTECHKYKFKYFLSHLAVYILSCFVGLYVLI